MLKLSPITVSLSLPKTPDVDKLVEMFEEEKKIALQYHGILKNVLGGVIFSSDFNARILSVYPLESNGMIANGDDFVRSAISEAIRNIDHISFLRYEASVSGAMRWPWSQEAKINVEELRYE